MKTIEDLIIDALKDMHDISWDKGTCWRIEIQDRI